MTGARRSAVGEAAVAPKNFSRWYLGRRWSPEVVGFGSAVPGVVAFAVLTLAVLTLAAPRLSAQSAQAPEARLEAIADLVRTHRDAEALRLLEAMPPAAQRNPRVRYLRARLLERRGELADAADLYDPAGLPEGVAEDVRWRRAVALARSGRCAEAIETLVAFGEERGYRAQEARALAAECRLQLARLDEAARALREVAEEDARYIDTFATRMHLAEALERKGEREAAIEALRSLLVDRPEHPDAVRAEAQLEALGGSLDFDFEARMERAERLHEQRQHRRALEELEAAGRPRDREDRARWLHQKGMALFRTRHEYDEASRVLAQAARLGGPTAEEDAFHAARALARADDNPGAIRAFRRFVRRHPGHRRAALAEYLAAWLELREGRRSGERRMEQFLRGPRARGSLARDARWHLGLRAFERGRYRDAAHWLAQYAELGDGAMVRGRGLYWLGRARMAAGDRAGALRAWREVLEIEPLHWYALLARQRLTAAGETPPAPFDATPRDAPEPIRTPPVPEEVRFYASLGLRSDALDALRAAEGRVREAAPEDRGVEALVAAYHALGDPSRPYRLVAARERDELERGPDPANRWVWEAAYPRPWPDVLEPAARGQGLPPELLWGIMRQESGYDPEAVSYADAIGLLQMLPSTARRAAERAGFGELRREMLFDPSINVRLAAAHIGGLWEKYDGAIPLIAGAYNAGAHRVDAWLEAAEGEDVELDLFVERIPIDQTRNYVRRVTSHYAHYRYLSQDGEVTELPL